MSLPPPSNNGDDFHIFISGMSKKEKREQLMDDYMKYIKHAQRQNAAPQRAPLSGAPDRRTDSGGYAVAGAFVGFALLVAIVAGGIQSVLYVFRQAGITEWTLSVAQSVIVASVLVFTRLADRAILSGTRR